MLKADCVLYLSLTYLANKIFWLLIRMQRDCHTRHHKGQGFTKIIVLFSNMAIV